MSAALVKLLLRVQVREELFVDTSRGEKLRINFDIDFPRMPCVCELPLNCISVFNEVRGQVGDILTVNLPITYLHYLLPDLV